MRARKGDGHAGRRAARGANRGARLAQAAAARHGCARAAKVAAGLAGEVEVVRLTDAANPHAAVPQRLHKGRYVTGLGAGSPRRRSFRASA